MMMFIMDITFQSINWTIRRYRDVTDNRPN